VLLINTSQSYGASPAVWDHIVLTAARYRWTRHPLLQPNRPVLDLPNPYGWKAELAWVAWWNTKTVTHLSTNPARRRVTSLMRPTMLPLSQTATSSVCNVTIPALWMQLKEGKTTTNNTNDGLALHTINSVRLPLHDFWNNTYKIWNFISPNSGNNFFKFEPHNCRRQFCDVVKLSFSAFRPTLTTANYLSLLITKEHSCSYTEKNLHV